MTNKSEITTEALLDLDKSIAGPFLAGYAFPYEAVPEIKDIIVKLFDKLDVAYVRLSENVYAHKTAKIAPNAYIGPYTVICEDAEIRHCAFIRGCAVVGRGAVVGNSTELKNAILFDGVQVPHFNYVGDSVLGYKSHMGAGAVTSNIKSDKSNVVIRCGDGEVATGLRKLGAILADGVEVGCNSTLNPGTVICRGSSVYPNSCVRGVIPKEHIYKNSGELIKKREVI